MDLTRRIGPIGLVIAALLSLTASLDAAEQDRIGATRARIEERVKECLAESKAGRTPPVDELRAELESLSTDVDGLKALAKYRDHPDAAVAVLAVRAIGGAPEELRLYAGKLLAARVDVRYLDPARRLVYVETVKALGGTGYLGAGRALLKALARTKDADVCHAIVEALGRLEDSRAVRELVARLTTGTSVSLRGPNVGSAQRSRRQKKDITGAMSGSSVAAGAGFANLGMDGQPIDETKVTHLVYEVLSKLLGAEFVSYTAVDEFLRGHKREQEEAERSVTKKAREQEIEISRLLK